MTAAVSLCWCWARWATWPGGPLDFTESFRDPPESVRGLDRIEAAFGPGRAAPLDLVATAALAGRRAALDEDPSVAAATLTSQSRGGG